MKFEAKLPDESVNYSHTHPLADLFWIGGGLFALVVAVYFVLGWSVDLLAERISPEFEKKIVTLIQPALPEYDQSAQLSALGASLASCAPLSYTPQIAISKSKESNAYALPGGTIVINRGLLDQSRSQNELLFVIAHELGHFRHHDHLRGMGRALVGLSLSILLGLSDAPSFLDIGLDFSASRFSQEQEQACDLYAVELMQCHYGHVGGATDFFERLKEQESPLPLYFSTHPQLQERIDKIEKYVARKGYGTAPLLPMDALKAE